MYLNSELESTFSAQFLAIKADQYVLFSTDATWHDDVIAKMSPWNVTSRECYVLPPYLDKFFDALLLCASETIYTHMSMSLSWQQASLFSTIANTLALSAQSQIPIIETLNINILRSEWTLSHKVIRSIQDRKKFLYKSHTSFYLDSQHN